MAAPVRLTLVQVSERWPDALVLWDRDVAPQGWAPVFRLRDNALHADDPRCAGWSQHIRLDRACLCVRWDGERWELQTDFIRRFRDMVESDLDYNLLARLTKGS